MNRSRPRAILQALGLLWVSTGLGFAAGYSEAVKSWDSLALTVLLMLAVSVTLTVAVWRGQNWGRFAYVILVVLSFTELVATWDIADRPVLERALEAVSFVADAGSFFLMFTLPGSQWFDSQPEQRDQA